jgi:tetratricopeptide (TPR) repeat protein
MEQNGSSMNSTSLAEQGYWPAQADEYFAAGRYSRAVDLCLRKLDSGPEVISGRVILAKSLYHAGQFQQAREQFHEVLKFDATNLVALKYLGDILFREGEEASAMTYYRRIFEIDPHCGGLSCPMEKATTVETRQLTVRRAQETVVKERPTRLREPAFITETVGDIYRDQGYLHLAREVYCRLLDNRKDNRIAEKLRETEEKLSKREGLHESTH